MARATRAGPAAPLTTPHDWATERRGIRMAGTAERRAIIEVSVPIPLSDPTLTLKCRSQCARALGRSLAVGSHGLPLMGTGDWNDGMNRVGEQGRGESVWLGWFCTRFSGKFAKIADCRAANPNVPRPGVCT